jgi:CheY-like chemotaxis protein
LRWGHDNFAKMQAAQADKAARRSALAAELRERQAAAAAAAKSEAEKPRRFDALDTAAAMRFAEGLRFRRFDLELGTPTSLNRPTLELLDQFLSALTGGQSASLLQWPAGQRDISIVHPLAMLALLGSAAPLVESGHRFCAAVPDFRTLYFPWRGGGTSADQRRWLVDRSAIIRANALHLTRRRAGKPEHSETLRDLHEMLGHFSQLSRREERFPHLAHPNLVELYPLFSSDGGDDAPRPFSAAVHELFGRVRYGAGMGELPDHRPALCDPAHAPFGLFGITARADTRAALHHEALDAAKGGRPADICLLDLCYPGLRRLGFGWEAEVARFLDSLIARQPGVPVLAITQDSFVQRRVAALLKQCKAARKANLTAMSLPVIVRGTSDLQTNDPPAGTVTSLQPEFQSAAGASVSALEALAAAARGADPIIAGSLRRSAANLRRAAALPCGLDQAYSILCDLDGQAAAEAFLQTRSESSVLSPILAAIDDGAAGPQRERLLAAETAVRQAYAGLASETPIGSAMATLAISMSRSSSFSIVCFSDETDLRLARARFGGNSEVGGVLRRRLERGQVHITHTGTLEQTLATLESGDTRNTWRQLILVAPRLAFLDQLMIRPWLPATMLVLCDRAFALRTAGSYAALSRQPAFGGEKEIGGRLAAVASASKREAQARSVGTIDLELASRPPLDVPDRVVDMTDGSSENADNLLVSLESGRSLRVRPGSAVIVYRQQAATNPFDRAAARDLQTGDAVVVPDRAFTDDARRVLPIHILARGWVKVYHDAIVNSLPTLPGDGLSAKARSLHSQLRPKGLSVTTAAVTEWLGAETYRQQSDEQLRPHAPQDRDDFDLLMEAIGVAAPIADKMWCEGIDPLRIDRRRAGTRMAQAFISVLVDPHGVAAGLEPALRASIAELRERALDHLDTVQAPPIVEQAAKDED